MRSFLLSTTTLLLLFVLAAATHEAPLPSGDAASPGVVAARAVVEAAPARLAPDDCLMCHDDEGLTMEKNGRDVSLDVDPDAYEAALHGGLDCTDCHEGFDPEEMPHKEHIGPVDCSGCHDDASASFARSSHRGEIGCASCHGDVHTARTASADQQTCAACHDDAIAAVAESVHGQADVGAGCLDCHSPHEARGVEADRCLTCHGDEAFVAENMPSEDAQAIAAFQGSVHDGILDCADCHDGHDVRPSDAAASRVARVNVAETCAECHDDVSEVYLTSEHGQALAEGFDHAPTCTDCHGEHDIHSITDAESHISRATEVQVCLSCHLDAEDVRDRMTHTGAFVDAYTESAHGLAAAAGNAEAAVCSDCHGAHGAMKASDQDSPIHPTHIAETCSTCHDEIATTFGASIHGTALAEGLDEAPTCTTCHGEHSIAQTGSAASPVSATNVSEMVCTPCHDDLALSEKYGFPSDRGASFGDSYHGLAGRFGDEEAANCASCHGVHDILPAADPASKVHQANLAETCGTCHPGANINFTRGKVHVMRTAASEKTLWWITMIYLVIIVATVGSMFVHNVADWFRKLVEKQRQRHAPAAAVERKSGLYLRMTANERIQHALLASSFILLTITGFILKFPDAWWVEGLRAVSGEFFFAGRGLLHRVAAVVMVGAAFYHLYYIFATPRGRQFVRDIMFRMQDLKDLVQMLKYYAGASRTRPRFDRFNYVEKSEYWALVWGTIVMTATGIVMWAEEFFMARTSKLFFDINETVHYMEAWLAFLAIVVWHFYYVIFNPDVYPMNLTWLTGKITEEEMEHEHPLELERLKEAQTSSGDGLHSVTTVRVHEEDHDASASSA